MALVATATISGAGANVATITWVTSFNPGNEILVARPPPPLAKPPMSVYGHRGFKAQYPENTLTGFKHCLATEAVGIETDVWLLRDGVAIISHDPNTKRVFCHPDGLEADYNILDTDYEVLKPLVDIESREPLMTFAELLQWFVPTQDLKEFDQKLMMDIKIANPPRILVTLFEDMLATKNDVAWWSRHLSLGLWHLDFVKFLNQDKFFQQFDPEVKFEVINILFSWTLLMPFVDYNLYLRNNGQSRTWPVTAILLIYLLTWTPLFVSKFVPILKANDLALFSWTINWKAQSDYLKKVADTAQLSWGMVSDKPDEAVEWVLAAEGSELGWSQRALGWGFDRFFHKPVVSTPDLFATRVDPDHGHELKRSKLGMWVFQWLQRAGVL